METSRDSGFGQHSHPPDFGWASASKVARIKLGQATNVMRAEVEGAASLAAASSHEVHFFLSLVRLQSRLRAHRARTQMDSIAALFLLLMLLMLLMLLCRPICTQTSERLCWFVAPLVRCYFGRHYEQAGR